MRRINKIRAFTLNEMLVVVLLTTIVVGAAFAVLQLVQRQMASIDYNYERNTELNLLRQSLWIDFNQNDGIWYDEKTNALLFVNELRQVNYQILEDKVIRNLDTFKIALEKRQFFFKGDVKVHGEIDALDFRASKKMDSKRLFVYKKNAATSYLNQ